MEQDAQCQCLDGCSKCDPLKIPEVLLDEAEKLAAELDIRGERYKARVIDSLIEWAKEMHEAIIPIAESIDRANQSIR